MEDDDDFTFPTTVAAAEERVVADVATPATAFLGDDTLPGSAAAPGAVSSRLWPFAAPPIIGGATTITTAAAAVKEEDDDEDRMDMLWDDTAAAPATTTRSGDGGRAEAEAEAEHPASAAASTSPCPAADKRAEAAVAEHERMDLLWESFNEELLLQRAPSNSKKHADSWYLSCPSPTSSEDKASAVSLSSSPGRARYGCAPTMLRASSRAGGGAAQLYGSPRRRGRGGRGGGWALLLRLFRRLFAVDDDRAAAPPPCRHSIHVP